MLKKTIGIIGGMGPRATCDLMEKILSVSDANSDQEYVRICVDSNTNIPDRTKAILSGGEDPLPEMVKSAVRLQDMGADLLMMPCNTAYFFYDRLRNFIDVPLLHMPRKTAEELKAERISCAAVLATDGVVQSGIYEKALESCGIKTIYPERESQKKIMDVIYHCIKAGKKDVEKYGLEQISDSLFERGAQKLILGCTELPIAFTMVGLTKNLIDPTKVAAKAALRFLHMPVRMD